MYVKYSVCLPIIIQPSEKLSKMQDEVSVTLTFLQYKAESGFVAAPEVIWLREKFVFSLK